MKDVVTAIFELMGNCTEPLLEDGAVQTRVDRVFQVWFLFFLQYIKLSQLLERNNLIETMLTSCQITDIVCNHHR